MALSFFGPTLEKGTEQQARNGCRIHRAGSHGYVSCIQISNILAVNIVIVMQGYEPLVWGCETAKLCASRCE